jgi:hypothetical protein
MGKQSEHTISMTDDKEVEQQRLAERKAYLLTFTGDTNRLIEALKLRAPEAWQRFCKTVEDEGIIEPDVENSILQTTRSLFPGRKLVQMTDLLIGMIHIVREEVGEKNGGAR